VCVLLRHEAPRNPSMRADVPRTPLCTQFREQATSA
jgi:hypothetical protein